MAGYNRTRYVEELLERTQSLSPSFTVHLHPEYWTLNNGSKFLYNNQIASLLDDIRAHRIPVDFLELFESAKVPFYDGCMIVELLDYRPQRNKEPTLEKPERTRAVLHPNSETLWADICSLNQRYGGKWTDTYALEIEARLVLATSPPLCLDPDPHLTRIANHVLRVSTPTVPVSLKRKAAVLDPEEDETDKARRAKIMQFMNPTPDRTHTPSYRILDAIQNDRQAKAAKAPTPPAPTHQYTSAPPPPAQASTPTQNLAQSHSPTDSDDPKKKLKSKNTPQMAYATTAFTRANGSQTPVPPQATHQFTAQHQQSTTSHSSPTSSAHSPMLPQVYANVQAATEAAKRTPTPAQYAQSPRPPSSQAHPHPQTPVQTHPSLQPTFQPAVPNQQFLQAPPPGARNGVPKGVANNTLQPTAQQPPNTQTAAQAQTMYAQQLIQGQHHQQQTFLQRLAAQNNGRSTPQGSTSQATSSPTRGSPITMNPPAASRSPMPPARSPLPPNAQPPSQQQLNQQPQHPQHLNYTPQYNPAHLRPMVHGNPSPHSQAIPAHITNGNSNAQPSSSSLLSTSLDGQPQPQQVHPAAQAYPQMFSYQQVNFGMQAGRIQSGYWPVGMGRGVPGLVNGQMAGMVPNAQQVSLGVGKAVPGGTPGR